MSDWTSWVGMIFQTIAILGSVGAFIIRLHLDLKLLILSQQQFKNEVTEIKTQLKVLSTVVVDLARQDTRLNNLEARINELANRLYEHIKRDDGR